MNACDKIYWFYVLVELRVNALWITCGILKKDNASVSTACTYPKISYKKKIKSENL